MSSDKWAARNENTPKNGSDGNSLNLPRIGSASSKNSTRAHRAVEFLSPRSQANFAALRSAVSRAGENALCQKDGKKIPAWKKRHKSRHTSIGLARIAIKKSKKKKKIKKKKKSKPKKKLSKAEIRKAESARKLAEEEERQERKKQKKIQQEAQRARDDRARRAIAYQREYRRRVREAMAQRRWRILKNNYQLTQFETHKKVMGRAFVCVSESESRWLNGNQSGAVALLTQFAEKYRKIYPELDIVLKKAHGRSMKIRYAMLELCLLNMLETDEEKQEPTQIGKAVPRVVAPSQAVVKHQKYVEVTDHAGGPVDVLRKEDFTLHVVDHHNDLVRMRQELMRHAGAEVEQLWKQHQEEKGSVSRRRASSIEMAEQAIGIQDALFSHTDKLIAWHDDYSKNRSKIQSEANQSYELYKQQVQSINKKYEKKEVFGVPRGLIGRRSFIDK